MYILFVSSFIRAEYKPTAGCTGEVRDKTWTASPGHGPTLVGLGEVVQEFGYRRNPGHQEVVPSTSAGDIEQVTLGVVDFLQIGVVTDRLDTLLQGDDFVVTGHHGHGPEL